MSNSEVEALSNIADMLAEGNENIYGYNSARIILDFTHEIAKPYFRALLHSLPDKKSLAYGFNTEPDIRTAFQYLNTIAVLSRTGVIFDEHFKEVCYPIFNLVASHPKLQYLQTGETYLALARVLRDCIDSFDVDTKINTGNTVTMKTTDDY